MPTAGSSMASGTCEAATCCRPLSCRFFSSMLFRKMPPNPIGKIIYGVIKPNVRIQASIRLSIFSLLKTPSRGGIKIGMNAMWTGIIFCDDMVIATKLISNPYFNPLDASSLLCRASFLITYWASRSVIPEREMATAKVPSMA